MSSTFPGQHDNVLAYDCGGSLASPRYLCADCEASVYRSFNFDDFLDTASDSQDHIAPHAEGLGASLTGHSRFFPFQPGKPLSLPGLATNTSDQHQTVLDGFQSMAVSTDSHLQPFSSVDMLDSRLLSPASEDSSNMSGTVLTYDIISNHTYPSPISPSQATATSQTQHDSPQADRYRQFRCDHPSKRSPGTICGVSFTQIKDLGRHVRSVHALEDESVYRRLCSYKSARKDNYMRNLRRCTKSHELHTFSCICGLACAQKSDHVAHLDRCGGRK